jgi:DNA-directed RNA polymerase subunit RPC12/RpoP
VCVQALSICVGNRGIDASNQPPFPASHVARIYAAGASDVEDLRYGNAACNISPLPLKNEVMRMKEYRCRNCEQVFQIAELPGDTQSDPVQCPVCLSEDLEPLWASVQTETPPPPEELPEKAPDESPP